MLFRSVCDGSEVLIGGIMEHIEEAGVHSGDSACVIPTQSLSKSVISRVRDYTRKIALGLGVVGMVNLQLAVKNDIVYVLEANPRASRTVPFVSKATGIPLAKIAAFISGLMQVARNSLKAPLTKPHSTTGP